MKHVLIALLLLSACSSAPKTEIAKFECSILNLEGTFAKLTVGAFSKDEAVNMSETVRGRLAARGVIPNDTFSECFPLELK